MIKNSLFILCLIISPIVIVAQTSFSDQIIISQIANGAESVYSADLDGDGDMDVLSASMFDDKIAWYENDGRGSFSSEKIITTSADYAQSVYAADLDGDGDMDVLSASGGDNKIAWYENEGSGTFSTQKVITKSYGVVTLYATDLDGDGDMDILSNTFADDKIVWYENKGSGLFGSQNVITRSVLYPNSVYSVDLDGDGDMDVLSASTYDDKIAWYENDGSGSFSAQKVITTSANGANSVYAADLDGDGDRDVLSASEGDNKIAWYENLGSGSFSTQKVITTSANRASSVYAADLDRDGDVDVLSASEYDDKIAWYENEGSGSFSAQKIITTSANGALSVYAADLDGNGYMDVLSASWIDDKIAWYRTLLIDLQCNQTSFAIGQTTVTPGNTFEISGVIENKGNLSTKVGFQVNIFICTNKDVLNFQSSYFVGSFSVTTLGPGSNSSFKETATVPESVNPGIYYVWVSIDPNESVAESNETNNQQSCNTELVVIPAIQTVIAPGIPASLLPTIDGQLNDPVWSYIDEDSLLYGGVANSWGTSWSSFTDNLFTYKVCWCQETGKLYLAVNVQDDVRGACDNGPSSSAYFPYLDDAIEFFTDGDHGGGIYTNQQAQQWFLTMENRLSLQNYPEEGSHLYDRDDVRTSVQLGEGGNWTCEAAITVYNEFPNQIKTLQQGDVVGWDIWYDDSDNEVYVDNYYTRDHQTGWFYGGPSFWTADCFGDLILGPEIVDTHAEPEEPSQRIIHFNIQQNYPNPLNPGTRIQYELPKTNHVILGIYNLMGQEVVRLVDEVKDMGIYVIDWDGRDSRGVYLPSGVYIYQFRAGEFTESKKLILSR